MDIGAFGKGKGKQGTSKHGKGKGKGSKDNADRTRTRTRTRARIRLNVGTVESVDITRKTVGVARTPTKVVRRGNINPKSNGDAHNLDSTK